MECVLVLPILTLLIFAITQFALIWYAQLMTHYAAYNAARATLVYHPDDYRVANDKKQITEQFQTHSGVCWEAACRTLAWVSSSPDDGGGVYTIPGWWPDKGGKMPAASHIENQVRISRFPESVEMTNAPAVQVTVEFDYPLHVPVIGKMLAYFEHAEEENPSHWEVTGWTPDPSGMQKVDSLLHKTMEVDYLTLKATAVLPKPWQTTRWMKRP